MNISNSLYPPKKIYTLEDGNEAVYLDQTLVKVVEKLEEEERKNGLVKMVVDETPSKILKNYTPH
jgi:hypothetical protein